MGNVNSGGERGVKRYEIRTGSTPSCPDYWIDEEIENQWVVLATSYDALAAERDRLVELLRDADLIIEEWIEILKDGNMKCTAIDGEQWRIRPALLAALSGGRT